MCVCVVPSRSNSSSLQFRIRCQLAVSLVSSSESLVAASASAAAARARNKLTACLLSANIEDKTVHLVTSIELVDGRRSQRHCQHRRFLPTTTFYCLSPDV